MKHESNAICKVNASLKKNSETFGTCDHQPDLKIHLGENSIHDCTINNWLFK